VLPSAGMRRKNDKGSEVPGEGITSSGVKKTIWFHEDEAEKLRTRAFKERRSESSLVREAVRLFLRMED
jgi:hypothetical protein